MWPNSLKRHSRNTRFLLYYVFSKSAEAVSKITVSPRRAVSQETIVTGKIYILLLRAMASHLVASRNKKLLGAPGLTTRSEEATRGSWQRY